MISQQAIGFASSQSPNLFGMDGMLGLAPVGLSRGKLVNAPKTTIPTVTRNLYTQNVITHEVISIFFLPAILNSHTYGEITFSGTDPTRYPGQIAYMYIALGP